MNPDQVRVLVVAAREPWPLSSGYTLRLFHVLRCMAERGRVTLAMPGPPRYADRLPGGVHVDVVSEGRAVDSANSRAATRGARREVSEPWGLGLARRHFGRDGALERWLQRRAEPRNFDIAVLCGQQLGQYVQACRVPVVWDCVDELVLYTLREARQAGWRSWWPAVRHGLLYALYERAAARRAGAAVFASHVDAAYARRWAGGARVETISNGVDLDYFRASGYTPEPGAVGFVGSLEFPPNVDAIVHFASRTWPQIRARGRDRKLLIVGRRPTQAVRALAGEPGIELAPDVGDVRPYLARAAVVVVPTRSGGGVKNKILEACAMRRPVVASPCALGGLSARVGVDLRCAARPEAWVSHVCDLLDHPDRARRTASSGYEWVRRAHAWPTVGRRFWDLVEQAAGARSRHA